MVFCEPGKWAMGTGGCGSSSGCWVGRREEDVDDVVEVGEVEVVRGCGGGVGCGSGEVGS